MLNGYFDNIYCLNLSHRTDRWKSFSDLSRSNGFSVERFEAVNGAELKNGLGNIMEENPRRNSELACKIGHLRIIRDAKRKGYESILILEDDLRLRSNWENIFRHAYDGLPADWELFYLGVNNINPSVEVAPHLSRVRTGFTTHAYAVHRRAFDLIIEAFDYRGQADVLLADYIHPRGNSYCISPNIAIQASGFSDITNKIETYSQL
jgi:GR25 family glycosyltransferase involved in LPS biosynthesis